MKNIVLLFVVFSFLSSCSDDPKPEVTRGKATFKVGSVEKVFTKLNSFNNGVLSLANSTTELVGLTFPVPTDFPTTYTTDTTDDQIVAFYRIDKKDYTATNGILGIGREGSLTITITKYSDAKISGTFEFTGVNDKEEIVITQGVFTDIPDL